MKCPNCGTADYIEGIFGPSCINASCRNHHGGYATIPEAPPPLSRVDLKKLVHLLDKMDPRGAHDFKKGDRVLIYALDNEGNRTSEGRYGHITWVTEHNYGYVYDGGSQGSGDKIWAHSGGIELVEEAP